MRQIKNTFKRKQPCRKIWRQLWRCFCVGNKSQLSSRSEKKAIEMRLDCVSVKEVMDQLNYEIRHKWRPRLDGVAVVNGTLGLSWTTGIATHSAVYHTPLRSGQRLHISGISRSCKGKRHNHEHVPKRFVISQHITHDSHPPRYKIQ